ncbi:MAG: 5-formyltetrahydrofolate cyclo-ligase [Nitrospiraceae bacterium]|nr:5-formyltetrahydrofolate cyclo-ligase [Nitrospiraceae bacterium]
MSTHLLSLPIICKGKHTDLPLLQSYHYRKQILSKRDGLSVSTLDSLSKKIIRNLIELDEYKASKWPLFYVSFRSEVGTHQLLKERLNRGLKVAVPKSDVKKHRLGIYLLRSWEDLRPGAYGIPEPDPEVTSSISPAQIDLVMVPGSVFDRHCSRYGYGGGYYDRFLSEEAPQAIRIGLAFGLQVLPEIPQESHDQRMDIIVTENERLRCGRR